MMTYRTNTAKPLNQYGRFPIRVALDKSFKTSELRDVKKTILYLPIFIKMYSYSAMAFDSCNRIYSDLPCHDLFLI
jgi:hypothetical protein